MSTFAYTEEEGVKDHPNHVYVVCVWPLCIAIDLCYNYTTRNLESVLVSCRDAEKNHIGYGSRVPFTGQGRARIKLSNHSHNTFSVALKFSHNKISLPQLNPTPN